MESELRERLLKSPRVKAFEERWKMALRFTSEEKQENSFNIYNLVPRAFSSTNFQNGGSSGEDPGKRWVTWYKISKNLGDFYHVTF